MTTETTIALAQLVPGSANVRRSASAAGIGELAASLSAHGLIQNLVVRKASKGNKYEVIAGGRRLAALKALMKAGKAVLGTPVTKAFPVRVVVSEDGNDTELSLAENTQREAMHPVDEVLAYRELVEQGIAVEDIAARFGQSMVTVRQRLKLAGLSPRILDELRNGEMSLEQAKALAVSDDHAAQEDAWFGRDGWSRNPSNLRATLTREHVQATDRLARYVGLETYEQEGGQVVRDLFAEDGDTYLTDRDLLNGLAARQLEAVAGELREHGWKWVEVCLDGGFGHQSGFGRIHPERRAYTDEEQAELATLGERFDAIAQTLEALDGNDPASTEAEAEQVEVERRIEAIEHGAERYLPDEQALAGCFVGVSYGGALQVVAGVVKPEDRKALADLYRTDTEDGAPQEDAAPTEQTRRMPDTLVQELTAVRTAALRVELARNPGVALAAVLHPLVLGVFYGHKAYRFSSAVEVSGQERALRVAIKEPETCRALSAWNALLEAWTPSLPADPEELWGWLLAQEQPSLLELLAVVGAASLNATQARQGSDPARMKQAAQVAEAIAFDTRTWWSADAPFLSRLTKLAIADALREAGCTDEAATGVERGAKAEAVALAEKALDGTGWLPEVLRMAA